MDSSPVPVLNTGINSTLSPADAQYSDHNLSQINTLEKKANHLRSVLEKDFKAADFKWSLFVASAFSYRYESCLRPFPPAFVKNGIKDMDELLGIITDVPALDLVLHQLDDSDTLSNNRDLLDLLFFVLVKMKEPGLRTIPPEVHETILSLAKSSKSAPRPQHIFQVVSSSQAAAETKWKDIAKCHNIFYAFHGNRLENFYSILHFGLQQHSIKSSGYGKGVYLSSDLNTSLPFSHGGYGWGASCIGGHLSCVAMCEIADVPEGINYQKNVTNEGDGIREDERSKVLQTIENSLITQNQHYIVSNCDLVRVRYLLVYAKESPSMKFAAPSSNRSTFKQWLTRHKLFSIVLGYGLMLATIGFANNQPVHHYCNMLIKKLQLIFGSNKGGKQ